MHTNIIMNNVVNRTCDQYYKQCHEQYFQKINIAY